MAQHKGAPRPPGSGRAKGTSNKLTSSVKEYTRVVFEELQRKQANGLPKYRDANMLSWAQAEPTEFYRIAARLIPTELTGTINVNGLADLISGIQDHRQLNDRESAEPDRPVAH